MNKIFGIGLPKTGTSSLAVALRKLGYDTLHNPMDLREEAMRGNYHFKEDRWDAITNFGEHFYPQLDKAYPNSKFILTVRNREEWLLSWQRQVGKSTGTEKRNPLSLKVLKSRIKRPRLTVKRFYDRIMHPDTQITKLHVRIQMFGTFKFNADRCLYVYDLHYKNVMEYFKDRPQDLLVLNIPAGDGWEKLCDFLGVSDIPAVEFPHNKPRPSPGA